MTAFPNDAERRAKARAIARDDREPIVARVWHAFPIDDTALRRALGVDSEELEAMRAPSKPTPLHVLIGASAVLRHLGVERRDELLIDIADEALRHAVKNLPTPTFRTR